MSWQQLLKAEISPISVDDDGWFHNVLFEEYGDKLILHYRPKDYSSLENMKPFNDGKIRELHISIHPDYQRKGFAEKMVVGALMDTNGALGEYRPFWLAYGRITNPHLYKVADKLKNNSELKVTEIDEKGLMIELMQ